MTSRLGAMTWPEVSDGALLVIPTGSCEQHGPHLPLDTDTRIAVALANELARRIDGILVGPAVAIGASGEHQAFPGTLSIGTTVFEAVVVELCRSALPPAYSGNPAPFAGVVFVNGHGGNIEAFSSALNVLHGEGRRVLAWHPRVVGGDSHAGRTETSMLLHLDPDCVREDLIEPGSTARWRDIGATVMAEGLAAVTPNGILGDPTTATAAKGSEVFETLVDDLCSVVGAWLSTNGLALPEIPTALSTISEADRSRSDTADDA
ncbi:MAG: mycofactocin biosynthesis peptidyl-dipeptidase MftE [Microthrixaceae bacterium]